MSRLALRARLQALVRTLAAVPSIQDQYVTAAPAAQHAVDIFRGEWSSAFPAHTGLVGGESPVFDDERIHWLIEALGGVAGLKVLELGPLEGGHTYMLEQAGAGSVLAVEANSRAFLKCLVVKELLSLRSAFQLGDFNVYLETTRERFDLCLASGVLYHMVDPLRTMALVARVCERAFFWTHYFDAEVIHAGGAPRPGFATTPVRGEYEGFTCPYYRVEYGSGVYLGRFCGGPQPYAHWMAREDLLAGLRHFGFGQVQTALDDRGHPNGPCLCILAAKS